MFDGFSRQTNPLAPIGGVARGIRKDSFRYDNHERQSRQATGGRWTNEATGRGKAIDRHAHTRFDQPVPIVYPIIDALIEFNALAARIVNREPDDAIREGVDIDLGPDSDPDVKSAIIEEVERTGGLEHLADARRWARAYGGGLLVAIVDDGRKLNEPIDMANIRRVVGFESIDRYEADPVFTGGRITHYRLSNLSHATIHSSRVFAMRGTKLPRRVREYRRFWGGSVLDLVWDALRNYADAIEGASEALTLLTQGVFSSKNLSQAVDAGDVDRVVARIEALRIGMGLMGDIVIDPDEESYEIKNRPVSGVGEVLKALQEFLVAATDMPTSVLFGKTPGGLNSGDNAGEIRSWYDHVAALQKREYTPAMRWMYRLIMAQSEGPTGGEVLRHKVVWPSLWQATALEQAQTRVSQAQGRALDKSSGVLSPEELRRDPALVDNYDDFDPDAEPPPEPEPTESPLGAEDEAEDLPPPVPTPLAEIPPGENLMPGKQIANLFGFKSASPIRNMHRKGLIGGWQLLPGGPYRFSLSQVQEAIMASQ